METSNIIQQLVSEKKNLPITSNTELNIESRNSASDYSIIKINYSALLSPRDGKPQVVVVPHGYGFYWLRTYNAGWTDNKAVGTRPLEGFDFDNANQYVYDANRAQLVAIIDDKYAYYEPKFDESLGGSYIFPNRSGKDWQLFFYINDRMDAMPNGKSYYSDNAGSANCDFVVYRLPDA
ncbi:MAG: hypothetical protein J0L56_14150 [Chitinophagales bacterium]|nr:hypothetical protein [Chitinophagales bacterium]